MRVEDMDEGEVGESAQNVVEERHGVKDLIPLLSPGKNPFVTTILQVADEDENKTEETQGKDCQIRQPRRYAATEAAEPQADRDER